MLGALDQATPRQTLCLFSDLVPIITKAYHFIVKPLPPISLPHPINPFFVVNAFDNLEACFGTVGAFLR